MNTLKLVPRLELETVSIGFGKKPILENLTFAIKPGELIAIAGPNGGGKTTLLKTIGGLLRPLSGTIMLDGQDISLMAKREKALKISFLFQGMTPDWAFTVEELVGQGRFPHHNFFGKNMAQGPARNMTQSEWPHAEAQSTAKDAAHFAAQKTAVDAAQGVVQKTARDADNKNPVEKAIMAAGLFGFEKRVVTELSGGEFQRVLIARSMAQEARLLLLDEPANNLDPRYQYLVMNLVRSMTSFGRVALVSVHDLNLASFYADRVMLVAKGGIVALGKPSEVLREDILEDVFGIPLVVAPHTQNPYIQAIFPPLPDTK
jgi:iron complex transport system ATP-binding protein